jgi:hypothetical protein
MRIRRPHISAGPVMSLALLIVVMGLWISGRWHSRGVAFFTALGEFQAVAAERSGILLFFSNVPFGPVWRGWITEPPTSRYCTVM